MCTVAFIDYYHILGVSFNCSQLAIDEAYNQLPKLTEIITAYKILSNPILRVMYDIQYINLNESNIKLSKDFEVELTLSRLCSPARHSNPFL